MLSVLRNLRPFCDAALTFALLLQTSACIKRTGNSLVVTRQHAYDQRSNPSPPLTPSRINLNTASTKELETLPGIGKGLAERIIEHRENHGPFRRPEHLLIVRGISEKRFRALRDWIAVD